MLSKFIVAGSAWFFSMQVQMYWPNFKWGESSAFNLIAWAVVLIFSVWADIKNDRGTK